MKRKLIYINAVVIIVVAGILSFAFSTSKSTKSTAYQNKCGIVFPEPKSYVSDFVSLFLPAQVQTLDSIIAAHETQTGNEIAIITTDSSMLGKCSVDEYTFEIANYWGVGKKDKNNGIVINIAPSLKQIRIENGYGIEKILSDEETKTIIDSVIIPEFKKADYFEGTRKGLLSIISKLTTR